MIDVNSELPLPLRPVYALIGSAFSGKSTLARALSARGLIDIWPLATTEPAQEWNKINTGHHVYTLEEFIMRRPYLAETKEGPYFYAIDNSLEPRTRAPLLVLTPSQAVKLTERVGNLVIVRITITREEIVKRARSVNLEEAEIKNLIELKEQEDSLFEDNGFTITGTMSIEDMVTRFNLFSQKQGLLLEDPLNQRV